MNQSAVLLFIGVLFFASTIFTTPIPPHPQAYTTTGQTYSNGVLAEYQLGIDRANSRSYSKTVIYGVLVSKVVLQDNTLYNVIAGGPGKNPFEYSCTKTNVADPSPLIDSMDMLNIIFAHSSFVSQIGVKDPKNPPSIVLANGFNVTQIFPNTTLFYFVNPADQSLLSIFLIPDQPGSTQLTTYSFNRWEEKVYDDDFDIPIDVSKCTSSSLSASVKTYSQYAIPLLQRATVTNFWK